MTTKELIKSLTHEQLEALLEALTLPGDEESVDAGCFDIVVGLSGLIEDRLHVGGEDAQSQES